jgi:MinD-like ATPase involved in chromosome partitioning or flagellar assembly
VVGEEGARLALELAHALHGSGRRVLVLDRGFGDVARTLGRTGRYELRHALAGERPLRDVALEAAPGLVAVPAARALDALEALPPARWWSLCQGLDVLGPFDVVVLSGAPPAVPEAGVLVTLAPTQSAITQAYTELKQLARRATPRRCDIVVHRARSEAAALDAFDSVALTAGRFLGMTLALAGTLPTAGRHAAAAQRARAAAALRIAERLLCAGPARKAVNH